MHDVLLTFAHFLFDFANWLAQELEHDADGDACGATRRRRVFVGASSSSESSKQKVVANLARRSWNDSTVSPASFTTLIKMWRARHSWQSHDRRRTPANAPTSDPALMDLRLTSS
jgi:hypothetical protein